MSVDAVIFDWGGTLTPWKTTDGRSWWRVAAAMAERGLLATAEVDQLAAALAAAETELWRRSREEHVSGSLTEVFATIGLTEDLVGAQAMAQAYAAFDQEWEWATFIDPDAPQLLADLRDRGIRVGVLSNTAWPRVRHEQIFIRDGVAHLIDGAVYTSDIEWTKPHPQAFRAAMDAVSAREPGRCVFVGDRLFDDIFGAQQVGMRAVFLPHSDIPEVQRGHTEGQPDAVIQRLADLIDLIDAWRR